MCKQRLQDVSIQTTFAHTNTADCPAFIWYRNAMDLEGSALNAIYVINRSTSSHHARLGSQVGADSGYRYEVPTLSLLCFLPEQTHQCMILNSSLSSNSGEGCYHSSHWLFFYPPLCNSISEPPVTHVTRNPTLRDCITNTSVLTFTPLMARRQVCVMRAPMGVPN